MSLLINVPMNHRQFNYNQRISSYFVLTFVVIYFVNSIELTVGYSASPCVTIQQQQQQQQQQQILLHQPAQGQVAQHQQNQFSHPHAHPHPHHQSPMTGATSAPAESLLSASTGTSLSNSPNEATLTLATAGQMVNPQASTSTGPSSNPGDSSEVVNYVAHLIKSHEATIKSDLNEMKDVLHLLVTQRTMELQKHVDESVNKLHSRLTNHEIVQSESLNSINSVFKQLNDLLFHLNRGFDSLSIPIRKIDENLRSERSGQEHLTNLVDVALKNLQQLNQITTDLQVDRANDKNGPELTHPAQSVIDRFGSNEFKISSNRSGETRGVNFTDSTGAIHKKMSDLESKLDTLETKIDHTLDLLTNIKPADYVEQSSSFARTFTGRLKKPIKGITSFVSGVLSQADPMPTDQPDVQGAADDLENSIGDESTETEDPKSTEGPTLAPTEPNSSTTELPVTPATATATETIDWTVDPQEQSCQKCPPSGQSTFLVDTVNATSIKMDSIDTSIDQYSRKLLNSMTDLWKSHKSFEDRTNETIGNITLTLNSISYNLQLLLSQNLASKLNSIEMNNNNQISLLESAFQQLKGSLETKNVAILAAQNEFITSCFRIQTEEDQYYRIFSSQLGYINETLFETLDKLQKSQGWTNGESAIIVNDTHQNKLDDIHKLLFQLTRYIKQNIPSQGQTNHQKSSPSNGQVINSNNNTNFQVEKLSSKVQSINLKPLLTDVRVNQSKGVNSLDEVSTVRDANKKINLLPTQKPPEKQTELEVNPIR